MKEVHRIISNALMKAGFNFDDVNDTLLFDLVYEDHVVRGESLYIYKDD